MVWVLGFNHALCSVTMLRKPPLFIFSIAKPVFGLSPAFSAFQNHVVNLEPDVHSKTILTHRKHKRTHSAVILPDAAYFAFRLFRRACSLARSG